MLCAIAFICTCYHIVLFFSEGKYFPYLGHSFLRLSSKEIPLSWKVFHFSGIHTLKFDWQKFGEKAVITSLTNKESTSGDYSILI
jgi:hypothetical protein